MDEDIAKWIIEYLFRQPIDEKIINGVISVLPLPNTDYRLTKSLLLRRIEFEISNGSISEKILDFLEIIEELDHREGKSVSESMKLAYCAVAVDITVRFLDDDTENNEKYLEMVRKVWRDRFRLIESLVTEESNRWMSEIEDSVKDFDVRERILKRNTRNEALKSVRVYLKDAWVCIGPPFLELVADKFGNVIDSIQCRGGGSGGGDGGVAVDNPCRDLVLYKGTQKGQMAQPSRRKLIATKSKHHRGAKLSCTEDESMKESNRHNVDERTEDESLNKNKRRRGDEVNEDEPISKRKRRDGDEEKEHESLNILKTAPTPELDNDLQTAQNKPTVVETNNVAAVENPTKLHLRSTPEVDRIQKALKSSTMDLRASVRDPLPDALKTAQTVASTIATDNVDGNKTAEVNPTIPENEGHKENGASISEKIDGLISATQKNEMKMPSSSTRRSLMEPNETRHTIEWNDSIDNSASHSPSRPRLGSPRGSKPSPLKSYDGVSKISKRRARKYWAPSEEEKLREGVEKFGKGNWKLILHCYRETFQDRTEVDLKDKWRNMTRSS